DAPDVNRSDINFDVVDGRIVFGLRGIKGMGTGAAAAIVKERKENGPFTSFMNFLDRCLKLRDSGTDEETGEKRAPKQLVNKKAIEVLIQTGGFDHLDQNRATLLKNYESAIIYEEKKLAEASFGQASLFEDAGIKEFADFKYEHVEEMPKMALLNMERDLIGCFVSGHPLDDWKNVMEKCSSVNSQNIMRCGKIALAEKTALEASGGNKWQRPKGTSYTAIGMLNGLKPFMAKSGKPMAFAKLYDMKGSIDITIFPKIWEQLKDKLKNEEVYAFRGTVDMGTPERPRETPSLVIDTMEDISTLQERSISEVHIQLTPGFSKVKDIAELKDIIFGEQGLGNCIVYFHLDNIKGKNYIVKANGQLNVSHSDEFIAGLKEAENVVDVWTA
ncbi:MAG: OB-fold nucleic acid binding domain-containing protein, partial [Treponema sp.]|nr:OB-fold nucleic acid binding domain-containing protein [Treponema sp.]